MKIKVKDAETGTFIDMGVAPDNRVDEIIESAAYFWEKDANAYILKKGNRFVHGSVRVVDAGLVHNDVVEFTPNPNFSWQ